MDELRNETMNPSMENNGEIQSRFVKGVVVNCVKLNVRKRPEAGATIITTLNALTEVKIDNRRSTDDFYKIDTEDGIYGYCMKRFIEVAE